MAGVKHDDLFDHFIKSPASPKPRTGGRLELIEDPNQNKAVFYKDEAVAIRTRNFDGDDYTQIWLRLRDDTPEVAKNVRSNLGDRLRVHRFEATGETTEYNGHQYEEWLSPGLPLPLDD